ncbi:hypothetical protein SKAU_G00278770 [Synaphobranchus kaupii]|uniref:Endonuclease/exonuclease/phosphatase domain-containing protein n=1 Tax=Synaphobranchus kaupii TaxID=118154 RepID=A0A9Q1EWN0_SYNKA|nr:hypothetical protein SKAU_G00278770 [Synaphobranchus kaupii]
MPELVREGGVVAPGLDRNWTGRSTQENGRRHGTCSKPELDLIGGVLHTGTGLELDWNWTGTGPGGPLRKTEAGTELVPSRNWTLPEVYNTPELGWYWTGTGLELDRRGPLRKTEAGTELVPSRNWTLPEVYNTPELDWNWTGTGLELDWNWTGRSTQGNGSRHGIIPSRNWTLTEAYETPVLDKTWAGAGLEPDWVANTVILWDFNIHVDSPSGHSAVDFLSLLECLDLKQQLVKVPTHTRGHILDLVITDSVPITHLQVTDLGVSDHKAVLMELAFLPPLAKSKRCMRFRNWKKISPASLSEDFLNLPAPTFSSVDKTVSFYNKSVSRIFDLHGPIKMRVVAFSRSAPWFTPELRKMKSAGRILERRVRSMGLTVYKLAFRDHQRAYSNVLKKARSLFYSNLINKNPGNSKHLFSTIDHLLKPRAHSPNETTEEQCNSFIDYFKTKVNNIRSLISSSSTLSPPILGPPSAPLWPLLCFSEVTQGEIEAIITQIKPSTSTLDPIPTALLKSCTSALSPLIT